MSIYDLQFIHTHFSSKCSNPLVGLRTKWGKWQSTTCWRWLSFSHFLQDRLTRGLPFCRIIGSSPVKTTAEWALRNKSGTQNKYIFTLQKSFECLYLQYFLNNIIFVCFKLYYTCIYKKCIINTNNICKHTLLHWCKSACE